MGRGALVMWPKARTCCVFRIACPRNSVPVTAPMRLIICEAQVIKPGGVGQSGGIPEEV